MSFAKRVGTAMAPKVTNLAPGLTSSFVHQALDKRRLTGSALGRVATTLVFKGVLPPGRHVVAAHASALMNAGPPASARLSFSSR